MTSFEKIHPVDVRGLRKCKGVPHHPYRNCLWSVCEMVKVPWRKKMYSFNSSPFTQPYFIPTFFFPRFHCPVSQFFFPFCILAFIPRIWNYGKQIFLPPLTRTWKSANWASLELKLNRRQNIPSLRIQKSFRISRLARGVLRGEKKNTALRFWLRLFSDSQRSCFISIAAWNVFAPLFNVTEC